jgi:hypothetical protein
MRLISRLLLVCFLASLLSAVGCGDSYQTPTNTNKSTTGVPPPSKQPKNQKKVGQVDAP